VSPLSTIQAPAEPKEEAKPVKEESKPAEATPPKASPPAEGVPVPMDTSEGQAEETGSPAATAYQNSASNLATGSALESSVQMICDMGFDKELVVKAMRAAYNNPDRAVEYLMSGIPEQAQAPPPPAAAAAGGDAAQPAQPTPSPEEAGAGGPTTQPLNMFPQGIPGSSPGGGDGAGAGGSPGAQAQSELSFLRNNPQFQALRQMVQANPQILQPMLQELGKQNPQLLQLINSNQGDFLRMLNESMEGGGAGAGGPRVPGMEGGEVPQNVVSVTPEEKESIDRLEAMGFDRALCIEAFFACDKNESLAANYLLEHAQEDFQ